MKSTVLYIYIIATMLIVGCAGDKKSNLVKTELTKYGMPINIHVPKDATFTDSSLGVMKDLTVQGADNYSLQIFSSEATDRDPKSVVSRLQKEISESEFFGEIVKQDDHGFIFKKVIGDRTNYDFRHVLIQGDTEYLFQTALFGTFTQEQVEVMYNSISK